MGLLDKILPAAKESEMMQEHNQTIIQEPPIRMYNHVEIFNEYKEYKKGKKSYEIQAFDLWLVETYPNMLYIKRD